MRRAASVPTTATSATAPTMRISKSRVSWSTRRPFGDRRSCRAAGVGPAGRGATSRVGRARSVGGRTNPAQGRARARSRCAVGDRHRRRVSPRAPGAPGRAGTCSRARCTLRAPAQRFETGCRRARGRTASTADSVTPAAAGGVRGMLLAWTVGPCTYGSADETTGCRPCGRRWPAGSIPRPGVGERRRRAGRLPTAACGSRPGLRTASRLHSRRALPRTRILRWRARPRGGGAESPTSPRPPIWRSWCPTPPVVVPLLPRRPWPSPHRATQSSGVGSSAAHASE
jgi:hypothetical protein